MITETRFVSNYLTKARFENGSIWALTVFTLCLFASILQWSPDSGVNHLLTASGEAVFQKGEYWRLFTSVFVHGDFQHLLANSFLFFIASYHLCSHFGPLIFPVASIFFGGIINAHTLYYYEPQIQLVGISGVIYFAWSFWLVLFFCLQSHMKVFKRLMIVSGVGIIIFFPTTFSASTSYLAHLLGVLYGILFAVPYYWLRRRYFASFVRFKTVTFSDLEREADGSQ